MRPVSSLHPALYLVSVFLRRIHRHIQQRFSGSHFAEVKSSELLPFSVVSHRSLLLRKLEGTDSGLQINKVISLRIAADLIHRVVVKPGEVFSFWKLIGKPTAGRGFPPGLQLSFGSLVSMEGGGLCQLSNLIHWMVLQSPLTVVERHRHATDSFPDFKRTVPFGTGATVFYNYLDFCFRNDTGNTWQICLSVGEKYLNGSLLSSTLPEAVYEIEEHNHRYVRCEDDVYRRNEIWRVVKDKQSGIEKNRSLLMKNNSRVLYPVDPKKLECSGKEQ